MCDAARSLQRHHDGLIQNYLRYYGSRMLDEIEDHFEFETLGADDVRDAFTF